MTNPSFSVITPTFRSDFFERCRTSVLAQTYTIQHVIVDGGSGDPWYTRLMATTDESCILVSEPDEGIYDALNKGVLLSTGDIVGILHSDDEFASPSTVARIAETFRHRQCDVVYGDLVYVDSTNRPIRFWKSRPYRRKSLSYGWMPPHPTVFVRKAVFDRVGLYDKRFRVAGDYDFLIRLFRTPGLKICYSPMVITRMKLGGESNRNLAQLLKKTREDLKVMKAHHINPVVGILSKQLGKIVQFWPLFFSHQGISLLSDKQDS